MNPERDMLTERQRRELEYHRHYAEEQKHLLNRPISYDVIYQKKRRWWNAYWEMYEFLTRHDLKGKKLLVVGCGFGDDALRLAKLGADVYAFDLSPETLKVARELAVRENLTVHFEEMPAESLRYESAFFDYVVARDILHHVNIPEAMNEIVRVSKNGTLFVLNEVYSHSFTDRVRHSRIVEKCLYPFMQHYVYEGEKPYITEDERKLTQTDIVMITKPLRKREMEKHFNLFVNRIIPDRFELVTKLDRLLLILLKPLAHVFAGRILIAGAILK
jgi:ubiquinone/menaquinone biosynthesis C-methylase UbiE